MKKLLFPLILGSVFCLNLVFSITDNSNILDVELDVIKSIALADGEGGAYSKRGSQSCYHCSSEFGQDTVEYVCTMAGYGYCFDMDCGYGYC